MKKFIIIAFLSLVILLTAAGCNKQVVDTTYSYERAIIYLPDGRTIEGKVSSWRDYEYSDQIQVKIDDKYYLVHSSNVVLISE